MYQPKTGQRCHCKPGLHRDNCPDCEGTGWAIDFAAIHKARTGGVTMRSPRVGSIRVFRPVGLDAWDKSPHQPPEGTRVTVVQPFGCPPNGTMGHCYVEGQDKKGNFYGPVLVLINSLAKE